MEVLVSTFEKKKDAQKFADLLIKKKLAACCTFYKIYSHYIWEGKLIKTSEWVLEAKTFKAFRAFNFLKSNHPYKCPMIYVFKPNQVDKRYLEWIKKMSK
jgi:periplasmic divalent cation tolerance protein